MDPLYPINPQGRIKPLKAPLEEPLKDPYLGTWSLRVSSSQVSFGRVLHLPKEKSV